MSRPLTSLLAGFTLWALAFMALYALQALGCVWGWPETQHRLVLGLVWLLTLVALGVAITLQVKRSDGSALAMAGLWSTVAAALATTVIFAPLLFVSLCV